MSKVIVFVLDRIVWLLLVTVITTQALQIAGIMETPKSEFGEISYSNNNEYNYQMAAGGDDVRLKRQTNLDDRSQFIDSLFNMTTRFASCFMMKRMLKKEMDRPQMFPNLSIRSAMSKAFNTMVGRMYQRRCPQNNSSIPISTLNALNNLVQSSRPAFQKLREYAQKRFEKTTKAPEPDPGNKTIIRQQRAYPVFIRPKEDKKESDDN